MKNEETILNQNLDKESAQYANPSAQNNSMTPPPVSDEMKTPGGPDSTKTSNWKKMATGAGAGVLVGSASALFMGMVKNPDSDDDAFAGQQGDGKLSHPELIIGEMNVASVVNDEMTFNEAFDAARAEIGPGGVFEWHGQIYATYTASEWNSMSAAQQHEFENHFAWNHHNSQAHSAEEQHVAETHVNSESDPETPVAEQPSTANIQPDTDLESDDIEIVSVTHPENHQEMAMADNPEIEPVDVEIEPEVDVEPEVEVLGVVHDAETGSNIGGMVIDGQEVILIDVDNDMTFDLMASDSNNNGQYDENEIIDIQEQNITVADLGGISEDLTIESQTDADTAYEG